MEKQECKKCGKVIEGYTENHVEHLMQQHNLKHEREDKKKWKMDKELISEKKDLNTIKLIRGQLGKIGWEIKLVGEDEKDILKRLKIVSDELTNTYDLNNVGGE